MCDATKTPQHDKANAPSPSSTTKATETNPSIVEGTNLCILVRRDLNETTVLYGLAGSILDYRGDAIVNAANTGGVTGFGVDERINRAGGPALKQARRALQGIPTGTCKSTPSFDHGHAVQWIIHAVGPVLRENALGKQQSLSEKLQLLAAAYENSMAEAARLQCRNVAFCLLSCGVFRGTSVDLSTCIRQGVRGIHSFVKKCSSSQKEGADTTRIQCPNTVCLVAYTKEEQEALTQVLSSNELFS